MEEGSCVCSLEPAALPWVLDLWMCACVCVCSHVSAFMWVHMYDLVNCVNACMCTCMHVQVCTYVAVHTGVCICSCACVCVHTYEYNVLYSFLGFRKAETSSEQPLLPPPRSLEVKRREGQFSNLVLTVLTFCPWVFGRSEQRDFYSTIFTTTSILLDYNIYFTVICKNFVHYVYYSIFFGNSFKIKFKCHAIYPFKVHNLVTLLYSQKQFILEHFHYSRKKPHS